MAARANLIFCLAHIYKDRAEQMEEPETVAGQVVIKMAQKTFAKIDKHPETGKPTGFVTLGQLEPALQVGGAAIGGVGEGGGVSTAADRQSAVRERGGGHTSTSA